MTVETTYGVTPTGGTVHKLPFNKNALTSKQSLIDSNTITGRRDAVEPGKGQIDTSGQIEVPLDVRNIGFWLMLGFGAPTTTVVTAPVAKTESAPAVAGVYKHIFTVADDMPSASIEKGFGDIGKYAVYPGCKINKLSLDAQVGNNESTVKLDMLGADENLADTSIAASATMRDILRFNNFNAQVMEGTAVLASARKMSVDIDFGLDGDTYCLNGKGSRTDITEGILKPTGSLEALFKDTSLLQKAIDGTESSLKLTFTHGAHSLEILLPELIFERATPTIDGPKGVLSTMNWRAYYADSSENSAVQITLINDVASYAG